MEKTVEITPEVRSVLERATASGPVLKLPEGQLDRPIYEAVDKVLRALGGKWDRRQGGHVFAREPGVVLAEALAVGHAVDHKRTLEQFWTPPAVVRQMCDLAGDIEGLDVLEPSAGNGCILFEIIGRGGSPTAVEIDEEQASQLAAETEGRVPVYGDNFLSWVPRPPETPGAFDLVLMNPPFRRGIDMAHVWRAFGFLKPYGCLISVMSPHWLFAQEAAARQFRDEVHRRVHRWRALPDGSFRGEGTSVNSGILTIYKEQ